MLKKIIALGCAMVCSMSVYAGEPKADKGMKIEEVKSKIIAQMDSHIKMLNEAKSCVQKASNHDDLKKCRASIKDDRQEMKKEHPKRGEHMPKPID